MLISNLTTLHLWGRTLTKYPQTRSIVFDDYGLTYGCIKTKLSLTLQVVDDLKYVVKEDDVLHLQNVVFDLFENMIMDKPVVTVVISGNVSLSSFLADS